MHTISFESNDGSLVEPMSVSYDSEVTSFPTPVKENNNFTGWSYNGVIVSLMTVVKVRLIIAN